ncbi:MAG TPA: hypothetical protein VF777_07980 [Phycisphaerales bacterium]
MIEDSNNPASQSEPNGPGGVVPMQPARRQFDWGAFRSHLTTFFSVVIVLGLGIGFLMLRTPVRQKAEAVVARGPVTIRFEWPEMPHTEALRAGEKKAEQRSAVTRNVAAKQRSREPHPTWLAAQFQEELMTLAYRALGSDPDPLSREPLDAVGAAMERSGWFDGRPSVERGEASEIVIRGHWRIPAAVVRHKPSQASGETVAEPKDYLVSWDTRPMPVIYPAGRSGLRVIQGVQLGPTKNEGVIDYRSVWPGEDVEAGVELLRTLVMQPWSSQVSGVDVSDYAANRSLVIETIHGTRLIWGGRASKPLAGECSTQVKLGKINELVGYTKRIDGGKAEIELWWPINKTLEIDRTATKAASEANAENANR